MRYTIRGHLRMPHLYWRVTLGNKLEVKRLGANPDSHTVPASLPHGSLNFKVVHIRFFLPFLLSSSLSHCFYVLHVDSLNNPINFSVKSGIKMMLNTLKLSRLASNCTDLDPSVSLCQQNSKTVTKISASLCMYAL